MSFNAAPPQYEETVSTASDTPTDARRMRTAATAFTDRTNPAPLPANLAMYKYRTKKAYRKAVQDFKTKMIVVYTVLAFCIIFALANLAKFKERQGWMVYLAAAQLGAIPVWCRLIYVSYRTVIVNKGGELRIRRIMWAVMLLCLNMQAVLAYMDVNDEAGMDSIKFLESFTGFIGFLYAIFVEGLFCWDVLAWFHNEFWLGMQADVERELMGRRRKRDALESRHQPCPLEL
ncbi:hypothetical protein HK104_007835 [Borealophlyctis nickersoniae]|nr:hypothetical protein HK104_007835 [Borealophlyctis nickersoniae]